MPSLPTAARAIFLYDLAERRIVGRFDRHSRMSGPMTRSRARRIATVALVVADYDEAIAWYTRKLGFASSEDVDLGGGKRWVTVGPAKARRAPAARASRRRRRSARVSATRPAAGSSCSWRPTTSARDHAAMLARGVEFREAPRREAYGTVAVFADLYGNLWDLIEPKR